jgi:hypothetical protein
MRSLPVFLLFVFVGCASAATAAKPTLRLTSDNPLVVQGNQFAAGERVVLTSMTGSGARRFALVANGGHFSQSLGSAKGCSRAYAVRAVGDRGSRAFLVFGEAPVCVPPPRD